MEAANVGITSPHVRGIFPVNGVTHRLALGETIGLRQLRDPDVALASDDPRIGFNHTGHHAEQCSFATAVGAHYANPNAVLKIHRNVTQNRTAAQRNSGLLQPKKMRHSDNHRYVRSGNRAVRAKYVQTGAFGHQVPCKLIGRTF